MGVKLNFAEIQGGFEPVPEGRYPVIIDRIEVRESKSSDYNYLNWEMTIQDDDHEGQKLWMITSLSPKALFRLKDIFVNLEIIEGEEEDFELDWEDDVDVTPSEGPVLTEPDLEGMAAVAIVHNELYEGKERNRVEDLLHADADADGANDGGTSRPKKAAAKKTTTRKKSTGTRSRKLR